MEITKIHNKGDVKIEKQISVFFIVFMIGFALGCIIFTGIEIIAAGSPYLKDGFINDEKTAIKVAKAIWIPIYGRWSLFAHIYSVNLDTGGIWTVEATGIVSILFPIHGGSLYIRIDGVTGTILEVTHTK